MLFCELNSNLLGTKIIKTSNVSDFDASTPDGNIQIVFGVIDNIAYISFDISWIRLQFRVQSNNVNYRWKYGQTTIQSWREF